jgi:hypothetical protein
MVEPMLPMESTPSVPSTTQFTVGVKFNVAPNTAITTGGYYSPRLDVRVPWLLVDQDLGAGWGLEAGYLYVAINLRNLGLPNEAENILRLGATYTHNLGQFTVDNRALIEQLFIHGGEFEGDPADTLHVRDRMRVTYHLLAESQFALRVYGYVEPTLDVQLGQLVRLDYSAGFGFKMIGNLTTDIFYIRETTPNMRGGQVNYFALQLIYRIPN